MSDGHRAVKPQEEISSFRRSAILQYSHNLHKAHLTCRHDCLPGILEVELVQLWVPTRVPRVSASKVCMARPFEFSCSARPHPLEDDLGLLSCSKHLGTSSSSESGSKPCYLPRHGHGVAHCSNVVHRLNKPKAKKHQNHRK